MVIKVDPFSLDQASEGQVYSLKGNVYISVGKDKEGICSGCVFDTSNREDRDNCFDMPMCKYVIFKLVEED